MPVPAVDWPHTPCARPQGQIGCPAPTATVACDALTPGHCGATVAGDASLTERSR